MVTSVNNPVPAGFDALPVLDLRNPDFTVEGNRLLAELRAKGPVCRRGKPLGPSGWVATVLKRSEYSGIASREIRRGGARFGSRRCRNWPAAPWRSRCRRP